VRDLGAQLLEPIQHDHDPRLRLLARQLGQQKALSPGSDIVAARPGPSGIVRIRFGKQKGITA